MADFLGSLLYAFSALFVILDPILSVPIFASMTRGQSSAEISKQAVIAVAVAGFLLYIFLFFNFFIFDILGISLPSFQVAGGFLLFILGMQMALGIDIGRPKDHSPSAAGVIIGTPLLCGPGAITTVILLVNDMGILIPAVAIALSLGATWIILRFSAEIQKLLGDCVTEIMARVLGMLVAAIAVKIIADGIIGLI
ncbi:MAG TPA: MarC family protein [Methanolinea sp.]|jgi:multiple antibiotic resistance protein|nr:MarC family protein [Methanolinea sp.]MDI6899189.1 MarC family protein [Methanolinea sp.]HOS81955.1 MarC family protein [Methanolinea sp.]HPC54613.1 MarC family protein [Methanolinea sp.]HQE85578.1 MarC family protein [Methanolinea sp.]